MLKKLMVSKTKLKIKRKSLTTNVMESYLMLAPFSIFFILLVVIPIIASIVLSVTSYNLIELPKFTGFENYIRLFLDDDVFIIALINTLIFAVITGPISYLLCFFLAWMINDFSKATRSLLTFVFYAPTICGQLFMIWKIIFSSDAYGIANALLMSLGIINEPLLFFQDPNMSLSLLIVIQLWMSLGAGFLAFIAGLQTISIDLYEAGAIDGIKNRWMELWYITLPSMKPMLLFGAITQVVTAFSVGDLSMGLAGYPSIKYSAQTISLHAYDYGIIRYELGYACAISVILFVIMYLCHKGIGAILSGIGK